MKTIIRNPKGPAPQETAIDTLQVPDLWHIAMHLQETGQKSAGDQVLECWHLAHDLLETVRTARPARKPKA